MAFQFAQWGCLISARPNILFIVCDDLNAWVSPLGRYPGIHTPAIERLARQGTLFARAYCAAPYCNASRMSVFTGCLPTSTGIYQNEPYWQQPVRRPNLLDSFRKSGYRLFGAGKVFHGAFDYPSAGRAEAPSATWADTENRPEAWDGFSTMPPEPLPAARPLNGLFDFRSSEMSPWNWHFDWGILPDDREQEMPDWHTVRAIRRFLSSTGPEPFFCAAGLYKPHLPWYLPQRFFDLYPLDRIVLPAIKDDDLDDVPAIARAWASNPPDHATIAANGQWRHAVQGYLAAVSFCDAMVGEILAALAASPAAGNTLVVLWGDNGFHLGEKLHWRKFTLWEEATRVPLIICAPPNAHTFAPIVEQPVGLISLFPTLLELCGLPAPSQIDGSSIVSAMQRRSDPAPVVSTWLEGNHSIRQGQWRYTRYADAGEELYNHATDPNEWCNLAGDHRHLETIARLRALLPRDQGS